MQVRQWLTPSFSRCLKAYSRFWSLCMFIFTLCVFFWGEILLRLDVNKVGSNAGKYVWATFSIMIDIRLVPIVKCTWVKDLKLTIGFLERFSNRAISFKPSFKSSYRSSTSTPPCRYQLISLSIIRYHTISWLIICFVGESFLNVPSPFGNFHPPILTRRKAEW